VSRTLGVEPVDRGAHPGQGTRNILFAMDDDRFLEVLGPDPKQPQSRAPSLRRLVEGALWWWAARSDAPLDDVRDAFAMRGVDVGPIEPGARIRPNGEWLSWETFDPAPAFVPALPFVIRWNDGPPVRARSPRCRLRSLRLLDPDPATLGTIVDEVGLADAVSVERGGACGVRAVVSGPAGSLELSTVATVRR
jgi:hypothetical protein